MLNVWVWTEPKSTKRHRPQATAIGTNLIRSIDEYYEPFCETKRETDHITFVN